jgi:predicted MFS family arabinose efflux permease
MKDNQRLIVLALGNFAMSTDGFVVAGVAAAMFSPTAAGSATAIVPRERVGFALSIFVSGMTISTALGSPLGTVIGGLGDWRYTMVFVALLAGVSFHFLPCWLPP